MPPLSRMLDWSPVKNTQADCCQRHMMVHVDPAPDHRIADTRQALRSAADEFVAGRERLAAETARIDDASCDRANRAAVIFAPDDQPIACRGVAQVCNGTP